MLLAAAAQRDASRPCIDRGTTLIHSFVVRLPARRSPEFIHWRMTRFIRVNLFCYAAAAPIGRLIVCSVMSSSPTLRPPPSARTTSLSWTTILIRRDLGLLGSGVQTVTRNGPFRGGPSLAGREQARSFSICTSAGRGLGLLRDSFQFGHCRHYSDGSLRDELTVWSASNLVPRLPHQTV
jgi:hypothetical protein